MANERRSQSKTAQGYEGGDGTVDVDDIPLYAHTHSLRLPISSINLIKPSHAERAVRLFAVRTPSRAI